MFHDWALKLDSAGWFQLYDCPQHIVGITCYLHFSNDNFLCVSGLHRAYVFAEVDFENLVPQKQTS